MAEPGSYKNTVNLPKTQFEMRANAVKREPELQKFWAEQQIYERLSQNNPGDVFILHDGPPYANGSLHIGHALNKILKDIINKYQLLQGRKVRYVPGWDCHGLPIELKVLQNMKQEERQQLTPLTLRQKAKDFALKTVDEQREAFKRYGVWGDWDNPYLTLKPEYEAAQIGVFGQMVLKGYIYRGLKPVHWSPSSKTALAEAELEYPEGHTSRSLYAAFPVTQLGEAVKEKLERFLPNLSVAIWTTTPWTIPANLAVSVNPDLTYAVVQVGEEGENPKYLIVAADLVESLSATLETHLKVEDKVQGKELEHCTYRHPLYDRTSPVVIGGDYVTTESGTGLVHTAPGHGQEDYLVGQRYGLAILSPVDGDGKFTEEAGQFAGLKVLDEGNTAVIEALTEAGSLLKEEPYVHKYPYDWRTKKPTIYRATEQWFASVEGFRDEALKAIASVNWIPAQGENRITAMVGDRSDWCISRQRNWGVPIPVFYDEESGEPLLNEETIAHVQAIVAEKGSDAWWELSVEELLPESYRNNGKSYRKGTDTMDVWFDSGSSWAAVAKQRPELNYPADMYLEGSDQHRGWFQSSLLTSVASNGIAPYKTVLTHGFTLDEQGRKMSKSLGNVIDPAIVIEGGKNQKEDPAYGADVLRLWVSSVDYSTDVPISKNILKQMGDVRGKIRNTARFLLGNLHDFDPAKDAIPYEQLPELDRYMLHRMTEVFGEVKEAFESFQFFRFFQTIQNFCVVDLSSFYLDIAKDRLYISDSNAFRRRSCQTVLAIALENLARAIAPVLCHMAEDIWQYLPYPTPYKSVFEAGWVKLDPQWHKPELAESWQKLRQVRTDVNKVLEQARAEKAIGSSLDAKVLLHVPDVELRQTLEPLNLGDKPSVVKADALAIQQPAQKIEAAASSLLDHPRVEQVKQVWSQVATSVFDVTDRVGEFWTDYKRSLATLVALTLALIAVYITIGVLNFINSLPLLEPFFQTVGLGVTAWFAYNKLLLSDRRQEFIGQAIVVKQQFFGKETEVEEKALKPKAEPAPALAEAVTPEPSQVPAQPAHQEVKLTNGVDELRYLFLASQVEILDSPEALQEAKYTSESELLKVGVVKAEGEKCDRCWNYSTHVGESEEHPLLCDRCVGALAHQF